MVKPGRESNCPLKMVFVSVINSHGRCSPGVTSTREILVLLTSQSGVGRAPATGASSAHGDSGTRGFSSLRLNRNGHGGHAGPRRSAAGRPDGQPGACMGSTDSQPEDSMGSMGGGPGPPQGAWTDSPGPSRGVWTDSPRTARGARTVSLRTTPEGSRQGLHAVWLRAAHTWGRSRGHSPRQGRLRVQRTREHGRASEPRTTLHCPLRVCARPALFTGTAEENKIKLPDANQPSTPRIRRSYTGHRPDSPFIFPSPRLIKGNQSPLVSATMGDAPQATSRDYS